ncbi:MAG: hypothetical protein ACTSPY_06835 [Candidatus Helarchaeota archaeon]
MILKKSKINTYDGKELSTLVSKEEYLFYFNKYITFKSKIGFSSNVAENWVRTVNIGINCIRQFFSMIIPDTQNKFYYYSTSI